MAYTISASSRHALNLHELEQKTEHELVIEPQVTASLYCHFTENVGNKLTLYAHAASACTIELLMTQEGDVSHSLEIYLLGEHAQIDINVATMQRVGSAALDIRIVHQAKHTQSNLRIQSMLCDTARLAFNGTIEIAPDCSKSHAYQKHSTLLLSDYAHVQSIPNLEIHANDVHCAHASATGQINEEHIAFLEQRGIHTKKAREMIVHSFFGSLFKTQALVTSMSGYYKQVEL